jgi:hypothetical protein
LKVEGFVVGSRFGGSLTLAEGLGVASISADDAKAVHEG